MRSNISKGSCACALTVAVFLVMVSSGVAALVGLPSGGSQVNDDLAAGINKAFSVSGEDPANADVAGGSLSTGLPAVPWAVFGQGEAAGAHNQVFSRSFAGGAWMTRGDGTVGGRSSASPSFSGSLNFDQGQDGEAPTIDFAGTGRTVPWATWYENTSGTGFANNNIFASRFDNTGDANQGSWIFGGQSRGTGEGAVPVPSLNIHTDQDAENPSVAGGSMADPSRPGPWITWQETSTSSGHPDQIFVVRPVGPGSANCDGVTPATGSVPSSVPAIGGFCWQQTGIDRFGTPSLDPSLNVDPTRNGIEPDIAFTGVQDSVPWVVWYETGNTATTGASALQSNGMVFAAKGISDGSADGGVHWEAVGNQLSATLDTTGTANHFGGCAESAVSEVQCSLNRTATNDAEDARVAAGTMNPANVTVPWVAWDEGPHNGVKQIFVSRLVGTGAAAHFALVNNGAPISVGAGTATRPDITFSGNTPYVSWREDVGAGVEKGFSGHFVNAVSPTFVLDESSVSLTPTTQADVREPISSSCTATPFNSDGSACQGGALGTPFLLFTNGSPLLGLLADAYQPDPPVTSIASSVGSSSARMNGTVNPEGASVNVSFQYGTSTAYGQASVGQPTGVSNAASSFSSELTGLSAGTTIHYRVIAVSDFGTFFGADQTLTTTTTTTTVAAQSPGSPSSAGPPIHSKPHVSLALLTKGLREALESRKLEVRVSVSEASIVSLVATVKTIKGHASAKHEQRSRTVTIATAKPSFSRTLSGVVSLKLTNAGRSLLGKARQVHLSVTATATDSAGDRDIVVFAKTLERPARRP